MNSEIVAAPWGVSEQDAVFSGTDTNPFSWFLSSVAASQRDESGVDVTETTAITHGPVWQALNILAGDFGLIPFNVRKRLPGDKGWENDERHPLASVMQRQTNKIQTPAVWKEWSMATALIWGNAVSEILRDATGRIVGLFPLPPQLIRYAVDDNGEYFYYAVHPKNGVIIWEPGGVVHFRGLTSDGFWGYRLVEVAAGVIGHGLALRKHGNATFKHGARPSGVLQHPGKMGPDARQNLRDDWNAVHAGPDNAQKVAILWEGMTFNPYSISNHDAEWLGAMRLDREQVAGIFNLPPHKLGALENAAVRANLEEQNREYYNTSLARHVNKAREEMNIKCLASTSRLYEVKPDPTELLKGDKKSQMETSQIAIASTIWSPNDARRWMGENPRDGGDEYGNPNTTPGDGESQQIDTQELEESARELVRDRAECLCTVERNRLENKAKGRCNFDNFLAEFYGSEFTKLAEETMAPAVRMAAKLLPVADTGPAFAAYAEASMQDAKRYAAKTSDRKELSGLFKNHWQVSVRSASLVKQLLGVTDENA